MPRRAKLREIVALLENVYAGPIGAEFAHVSDTDERLWLQDQFLLGRMQHQFSAEDKINILKQITAAEGLERYLHTEVRRPEALLAGRRRCTDPDARTIWCSRWPDRL